HAADPVRGAVRTPRRRDAPSRAAEPSRGLRAAARMARVSAAPDSIRTLVERFDATAFDARKRTLRLRLVVGGKGEWDVLIEDGAATIVAASGHPDAVLRADAAS